MTSCATKPIAGFDGYYVSDTGNVFSEKRGTRRQMRPGVLKSGGYFMVVLRRNGVSHCKRVHVLVALTFIGPMPTPTHEVRHLDGNPKNNNVGNLAWGTHVENCADTLRHGRWPGPPERRARGTRINTAKLSDEDVADIRSKRGLVTQRALAAQYGVNRQTIQRAQTGLTWTHIERRAA